MTGHHSAEEVAMCTRILEEHYGEPVYPVSQVCAAIDTWIARIIALNQHPGDDDGGHQRQGSRYWELLSAIRIDIRKSSLLGRTLYGREKLRTRPCPVHNGSWSGVPIGFLPPCGCELTGWLPE